MLAAELAARCGADFGNDHEVRQARVAGEVLPLMETIERIMTVKVSGNVYAFDQLKQAAPQVS